MAQSTQCMLSKPEDLSVVPRNTLKARYGVVLHTCNLSVEEVKTGGPRIPGALWPDVFASLVRARTVRAASSEKK